MTPEPRDHDLARKVCAVLDGRVPPAAHIDAKKPFIVRLDCFNDEEAGMMRSLLPERYLGRVRFTVIFTTNSESIQVRP